MAKKKGEISNRDRIQDNQEENYQHNTGNI